MSIDIEIPNQAAAKTSATSLEELKHIKLSGNTLPNQLERGLYTVEIDGFEYDFIYHPHDVRHDRLFVMLSGFADRKRLKPPVFQRWSWARYFPGHCLYIADPSLKLDKSMGLAWYVGTEDHEIPPNIANIVQQASERLNIPLSKVIFYASSGGGYAALRTACLLPDVTVVTINPQINIVDYDNPGVDSFLRVCFGGLTRKDAISKYEARLSLLPDTDKLANRKIIYAQNTLDTHHVESHFRPFAARLGLSSENGYSRNNIATIFFEHPGGHAKGEPPDLFPSLIQQAVNLSDR